MTSDPSTEGDGVERPPLSPSLSDALGEDSDEEEIERRMLILYATTTGNALDAAEQIFREAKARGTDVDIRSADEYSPVSLLS